MLGATYNSGGGTRTPNLLVMGQVRYSISLPRDEFVMRAAYCVTALSVGGLLSVRAGLVKNRPGRSSGDLRMYTAGVLKGHCRR